MAKSCSRFAAREGKSVPDAEALFPTNVNASPVEVRCTEQRRCSRNRRGGGLFSSPKEIIMRSIVLVLVISVAETSLSYAQGHMGTPQEQQACRRDAQRFCRPQLGNDFAVQQCLQQNRTRLTKSCQKVFASHGM